MDDWEDWCIECCSKYCCGHEGMGSELCAGCDCHTVCSDILDADCIDEEYERIRQLAKDVEEGRINFEELSVEDQMALEDYWSQEPDEL